MITTHTEIINADLIAFIRSNEEGENVLAVITATAVSLEKVANRF